MRFERVAIRGLGPFSNGVDINLSEISGKLVAVCGVNGAGKSTLLELLPAALYRETPTRGSLANLATDRSAYVEVDVVNGARYRVRQMVDAVSGKGEALVLDANGKAVLSSGKVKEYDAWAKAHVVAPEVMFCSTFAPQGSDGFGGMKASERKSVVLQVIGSEYLERLAELARKHAGEAKAERAILAARIADAKGNSVDPVEALETAHTARYEEELADYATEKAREELAAAVEAKHEAEALQRRAQEFEQRRAELSKKLSAAGLRLQQIRERKAVSEAFIARGAEIREAASKLRAIETELAEVELEIGKNRAEQEVAQREMATLRSAASAASARLVDARERFAVASRELNNKIAAVEAKAADTEAKIANNQKLLSDAGKIREAVATAAEIDKQIVEIDKTLAAAVAEQAGATTSQQTAIAASLKASGLVVEAWEKQEAAKEILEREAEVLKAAEELGALGQALESAKGELVGAQSALDDLVSQRAIGADGRIKNLRGGLARIAQDSWQPREDATRCLAQDDRVVAMSAELPSRLRDATSARDAARENVVKCADDLEAQRAMARQMDAIQAAKSALEQAEADAAKWEAEGKAESAKAGAFAAQALAIEERAMVLRSKRRELVGQRSELAPMLGKVELLSQAEARICERRAQLDGFRAELAELKSTRDAMPETPAEVVALEAELREAEAKQGASNSRFRDLVGAMRELCVKRDTLAVSRGQRLAQADNLQALESAEAVRSEVEAQCQAAEVEVVTLTEELASVPVPEAVVVPDISGGEQTVKLAEERARAAHAASVVAQGRLVEARAAEERIRELRAKAAEVDADVADWELLAQTLGRDGLQALEVDSAGPELTALINDLLHTCVGPRWTVSVETTRMSADGKRQLEGCEIQVLDCEKGREGPIETFSGGERVILGEAISLGIAMLGIRRAGLHGVTLVRDESGAALDPTNAKAYVSMLRRAAEIVDADKVLLVSHSPEVQEMCDSRIVVGNGTAVVN